ncbi:hypothetical protein GMORB2_7109 [Geosmithia morbida]|uniref:Uncharacterized protein n=1 Tax=Geosmithia morbida TaxID=1094350 RepID=A0A9P4YUJ1_9HYPO|nr:uncharacterized protein GMORB2_7109 [Geosmithia morbida]KAF4122802.1 hypothetical protein GMORB2_7109 [Geosmithia morbida]
MAANPFRISNAGLPLFNIYNDATSSLNSNNNNDDDDDGGGGGGGGGDNDNNRLPPPRRPPRTFSLPGGPCNYGDMSAGPNGPRCGCQRFWARPAALTSDGDDGGSCMCGHHACFHLDDATGGGLVVTPHSGLGQENERPRSAPRPPLSPVVDLSLQMPPPLTTAPASASSSYPPIYPIDDALSFIHEYSDLPGVPTQHDTASGLPYGSSQQQSQRQIPQHASSLPDTLPWGNTPLSQASFFHYKPGLAPSPGRPPSQATSTTSSARVRYQRPFAGKGLNTLTIPKPSPVHAASPETVTSGRQLASMPATAQDDTQPEPRAEELGVSREEFNSMSDTVAGHEQRIGRLETTSSSFRGGGHEECDERHDHGDLRMTDMEARMDEVEKTNHEHGAMLARMTAEKQDDAATQSVASFSTTASTNRPTHSQELRSEVQTLSDTVASMQYHLATPTHPWEIEVVFLPFPLKKLWQVLDQFKPDSAAGSDEWTQVPPMTFCASTPTLSSSPVYDEWTRPHHDADWLLPRAYSETSPAGSRLRSRGLVRNVVVRGPDARSVQQAMIAAFGDVWRQMISSNAASQKSGGDRARLSRRYTGLQSMWVPLRKVHKDSRLRLLSPAEMLNPTSWNVEFLSSVMMKRKTAVSRLYITHPDAYLQDWNAYESGWTWQRIRELNRVHLDHQNAEVLEADALETCWARDAQLDETHSTAAVNLLQRRATTSSPSLRHTSFLGSRSGSLGRRSSSPVVLAAAPLRHQRTSSMRHSPMPSSAVGFRHPSPALTRRRVVSYERGTAGAAGTRRSRQSSPSMSQLAALRTRRQTRSPSYPAFTPRMTATPSPAPMLSGGRQGHQRGTTPFAYATPHSNAAAPLQELRLIRAGSEAPVPGEYMPDMDELHDIEIYEECDYYSEPSSSSSDMSLGNNDDDHGMLLLQQQQQQQQQRQRRQTESLRDRQLPEDEPWPGIEELQQQDGQGAEEMSDGENVDPDESDASSLPSEYPSHSGCWPAGFQIHEDE